MTSKYTTPWHAEPGREKRGHAIAACCAAGVAGAFALVFDLIVTWAVLGKLAAAGMLARIPEKVWLTVLGIVPVALAYLVGRLAYFSVRYPVRNPWEESWPTCSNCGYDLTGNVSGVCPECGTKIESDEAKEPRRDEGLEAVRQSRSDDRSQPVT